MSGNDIPYQLRPNKFIDRQIFIDLLSRLVTKVGNEKFVYISMGGKHLVDHGAVYRQLGIPHLLSIENQEHVVPRQEFNKPIDTAICWELESGSLPAEIDYILEAFDQATNLIAWLDYTQPDARLTQLQEMIELLKRMQVHDILRITLNANLGTLESASDEWKQKKFPSPAEFRLKKLRDQLGDLVPTDLMPIADRDFPLALARCVELAVARAEKELQGIRFRPVLITTYRDGQRMMTVTVRAVSTSNRNTVPSSLKTWPFRATNWRTIVNIEAPDLSLKEKLMIDQHLNKAPSYILRRLKFQPNKDHKKSLEAVRSYRRLHRYYPEFRNVEA